MDRINKDFKFIQKEEIGYFVSCDLEKLGWLVHAFTTKGGGVSPLPANALNLSFGAADSRENVIANRYKLLKTLNMPQNCLFTIKQTHSDTVLLLDKSINLKKDYKLIGDAIVTEKSGLALTTRVADCYPILLADVKRKVIANIHAGWRGILKGIVKKTLETMQEHFGCQAKDLLAAIGPGIDKCCYEVGGEIIDDFQKLSNLGSTFWQSTSKGSYFLDLLGIIKSQLIAQGLESSQIKSIGLCTGCHLNLFFSYRKEGEESGRMMAIILKKKFS